MSDYVLQVGRHRLRLGRRAEPASSDVASAKSAMGSWDLPRKPLTARQIVESLDPLLEAVCAQLGHDVDRSPLLQSMAATLAIDRPESSLPLAALNFPDPLRRELAVQAAGLGERIAAWAAEANRAGVARSRFDPDALVRLELRSRCDGHPWTKPATALLTGARGGPVVMQLYNEWLHQLVLLRDALLPFENWQHVPLPLHLQAGLGLRGIEPGREKFLASFLTRIATHASIVASARALFDRHGTAQDGDVYGFQTDLGLVLPAIVGRDDLANAPKGLLTWHPAVVAPAQPGQTLPFRCAWTDYLAAPRSVLGASSHRPLDDGAAIVADGVMLWLEIAAGGQVYRVDLGQCLRGQRFAYRPSDSATPSAASEVTYHEASAALAQPGLVTADAGIHAFDTDGDPLLTLALLGKIYPENVVLGENAPWEGIHAAGKGYGAKFALVGKS